MTPKYKAKELFDKYFFLTLNVESDDDINKYTAKHCALIAVDECIESTKQLIHHYTNGDDKRYADIYLSMSLSVAYWQEVKQEIEKL